MITSFTLKIYENLQNQLAVSIEENKQKYYPPMSKKLMDPATSAKTYWPILKISLDNKKDPCILPLFCQYAIDFRKKAEFVDSFLANQCSRIKNSSKPPSSFSKRIENSISSAIFYRNDNFKIIQNLDPNKARGHDKISICNIKICGQSIIRPLQVIFKSCIENDIFSN